MHFSFYLLKQACKKVTLYTLILCTQNLDKNIRKVIAFYPQKDCLWLECFRHISVQTIFIIHSTFIGIKYRIISCFLIFYERKWSVLDYFCVIYIYNATIDEISWDLLPEKINGRGYQLLQTWCNACQACSVKCVSKIRSFLLIIFSAIHEAACFGFPVSLLMIVRIFELHVIIIMKS